MWISYCMLNHAFKDFTCEENSYKNEGYFLFKVFASMFALMDNYSEGPLDGDATRDLVGHGL